MLFEYRVKKILPCLVMALLAVAAFAEKLELTPEAWENRNPLGGDFTNGTYSCLNEAAHSFAVSKTVPLSSNAVASVTYTPVEIVGSSFKTAAVALYESPSRYWHLALVETPVGRRDFELCEMRDGQWLSHKDLKLVVDITKGTWKLGEPLRLSIAMDGKGVEGTVHAADGRLIFRRRFAFPGGAQLAAPATGAINCAPPVVACGRPALKCYGISGVYTDAEAVYGAALPERAEKPSANAQAAASHSAFYRTRRDADGRWWFVDPEGKPFFLAGAGTVNSSGDYNAKLGYAPYGRAVARKYPSVNDWATNTLARLVSWGFNMIVTAEKSVIRRRLPHTRILGIGTEMSSRGDYEILPCDGGPCTAFPNVFSPKFEAYCRYVAKNRCAPNKDDPWLIGYYIDNELSWWGDARKFSTPPARGLFDACAKKPAGHSARVALETFLKERGIASPEAASEEVTREFIRLIARRYFEITSRAIREADPNHLVLGCRFAGLRSSDPVVWEECGKYCDVVSVNIYPMVDLDRGIALNGLHAKARPIADVITERAAMANKPVIVTEWSFTALDSGLPCTHGAGQRFFTQRERAEATSIFARTLYALPCCAGYVYFKWSDQPAFGRKSEKSENSNYGLVDANDDPWPEQVAALAAIQNNPMKWRYAPLPQEKPVVRPSAETAARATIREGRNSLRPPPQTGATSCAPPVRGAAVSAADGSFVLSNGLIRLAGRIGGNNVSVGDAGEFSPSIREFAGGKMWWSGATEVVDARSEVKDGVGILDVTFRGKTKAGAFEVSERFYLPSGQPFFFAELRTIANKGARALPVDTAFFRLVPKDHAGVQVAKGDDALAPPKDGQPTPIPPCLWRPWRTGAWELPDGSYLGLAAPRLTGVDIRFWQDKNLHPDASFTFPRVEIAPGETFNVSGRPFVAGACCREGLSAWRKVCATLRERAK
jgi:hypothetical protein